MDCILIDVGVYTSLEVDLSEFDFNGISKVIMTAKNKFSSDIAFEREFTTAEKHIISITPEESLKLDDNGEYDFDIVTEDGKRYKTTDNGDIALRKGCGQCNELP